VAQQLRKSDSYSSKSYSWYKIQYTPIFKSPLNLYLSVSSVVFVCRLPSTVQTTVEFTKCVFLSQFPKFLNSKIHPKYNTNNTQRIYKTTELTGHDCGPLSAQILLIIRFFNSTAMFSFRPPTDTRTTLTFHHQTTAFIQSKSFV